ncbi:MAG TPA: cation-translocating P-type ATPase [Capillibacterium sp.]
MDYYLKEKEEVLKEKGTTEQGLTPAEARARLEKYGPNKLAEGKRKSLLAKFFGEMADPMVMVLIAAALISGVVGEIADTIIILMVVTLNAVLGVIQEGKAEKAIEALQKMASPYCKVRRGGHVLSVKSEELVPGDLVLLEAGAAVPADLRIIKAASLKVEEASLTGESVPVEKDSRVMTLPPGGREVPLGDRQNMAYMGTNVVYGRGEGVVVRTGMATEMGKIANLLAETKTEKTPLQRKLAALSRVLSIGVLAISVFIFAFGVWENGGLHGGHVLEMFLTAVSLAVAAVPEGLVAVVTIVLSIGVTQMAKRKAIIRRLTAVETLGSTQVICSDKTGTLTQNKMTVVATYGPEEPLAEAMALCNDATEENGEIIGEPTENALVRYALTRGLVKAELEKAQPRVAEAPFDSERKMMSTVHQKKDGSYVQYTKGALDELLPRCTRMLTPEGVVPLTPEREAEIRTENKRMAHQALRVLAAARREWAQLPAEITPDLLENDLIFIGLTGMIDPVRPEVKAAIEKCRQAGITPVMITGDHQETAVAIAQELGMIGGADEVVSGVELTALSDAELEEKVSKYRVYARVQPEHKVRIVNAWKKRGQIVAMTGDGVNDAPALKAADIGVGMGITGTDVSKNVSDMVLADDNFATIVAAVEEGRRIYDNILKAIQFLLSSNLSEVVALFVATLMNFRLFSPIHILWINLVTDSLPAIALGMEKAEPDLMRRRPRKTDEGVFAHGLGAGVLYQGFAIAGLTLLAYFFGNRVTHNTGMTMAFLTLSLCEIFHSLNMRSRTKSLFSLKTHNKYLFGAMSLSFLLTIPLLYVPGLNDLFQLTPLSAGNLLTAIGLALMIIPLVELVKLLAGLAMGRRVNP